MKNSRVNRFSKNISIKNRKANREYSFIETHEAGIILKGSEIKSIREGHASLQEAYCHFIGRELFIKSMNINPYAESTYDNHDPKRERKLLLNKRQLEKLKAKSEEKGLTIIPIKLYINNRNLAKIEIALAKGKNIYDKRQSVKKKDEERELRNMNY